MSSHATDPVALAALKDLDDAELAMLGAFGRGGAYWTADLALLAGSDTVAFAYRLLQRLEERGLVRRVLRTDPTSWRRTELGDGVIQLLPDTLLEAAAN